MSLRLPRPAVSRLGIKLFVVILAVNVAISGMVFLAISRSLDRGFLEYLDTTQANRAETLAEGLGEEWAHRGDWQWLRVSPSAWQRLVRRQLWPGAGAPPQGIERRLGDPKDFVLHDAEGLPVIGLPRTTRRRPPPCAGCRFSMRGSGSAPWATALPSS